MAKETAKELQRRALVQAYQSAGEDFFAVKVVSKLFCEIKTEEDRIRHNDALKEIDMLVEPDNMGFAKSAAKILLYTKTKAKMIKNIALSIIQIANKK